ncbi:WGxxGxxG family protein [Paenibacillus prosopidis]|uniref:WGxxGxxG family protein n=1 Tax=Paenibacillus prosopidis TaxID=630520 RepID=UPI000DF1ED1B|nr:WGxxGxxG family protein [Paenibacillus prosopidis]
MKKTWLLICIFACLTLVFAIPAFADNGNTGTMGTYNNRGINNTAPDTGMRTDMNRGINQTNRALGTDNYRATAAGDDNNMDWGWLGLIGLLGLAGLRNRDRERT